ncbi:MAG: alpha/beta hydrolase [Chloroflexota bacterium]|nr:alpha/beta hydrolase [Chloroflexota bacterium]
MRDAAAETIYWEAQAGTRAGGEAAAATRERAPTGAPLGGPGTRAGRAVIFLHGLTASGRYWRGDHPDRQLLPAADHFYPDLLGFGRSSWPAAARYTVDEHLSALRRWSAAERIVATHGELVLVGHSLGAVLALEWAARFPREVAGLFVIALPHYPDEDEARRCIGRASLMNRLTMAWEPAARVACWAMCRARPLLVPLLERAAALVSPQLPGAVAADGVLHDWPALERTLKRCIVEHRVSESAATIGRRAAGGFPVRLLHGADDRVAPVRHVQALAARTGLPLSILAGAGHDLWLSQPEPALDSLRNWFANATDRAARAP